MTIIIDVTAVEISNTSRALTAEEYQQYDNRPATPIDQPDYTHEIAEFEAMGRWGEDGG